MKSAQLDVTVFSRVKKVTGLCASVCALAMAASVSSAEPEPQERKVRKIIAAEISTGPNKYLDGPVRDHGTVLGWPMDTTGFAEIGQYNEGGEEALPLTKETPDDAILATFLDPDFITAIGFDPNDIDPVYLNVPLQDVRTLSQKIGPDGLPFVDRFNLPAMLSESAPFEPSIAEPNDVITLGQWKSASGNAFINCTGSDYGTIELRMKNLIPNRVYTVWSANVSAAAGPFNQPLGGAPSAVTTDEKGSARFFREFNFCPLEVEEELQAQMIWIMVVLHSDHMAYGGVFAPNADSLFGGTVAHVHLHFPLTGEPVAE